ncbi:GRF1-interacting factor 1-like [Solanum dulcamara]|uniref:GRF1-interacting factor 1-like n=1 Tax=Solanum dulcamara TaxID=45834 RepID=UPI0024866FEF|nr:GRF1-interacting factor 1-like [Solanum dulcamara]
MQQHLMQMQPMMAAYYPTNVTTDHIQQYLDENKSLILKIVESQNSGKLSECAENQARLQRNLMYLAAIADSQPQPSSMHSQFSSGGMMQPGTHNYLQQQQQQQAQQMATQQLMAARSSSMLYGQQQQPQLSPFQQQGLHSSQLGMSSGSGGSTGLHHMLQSESSPHGGGSGGGFPHDFGRANKQDIGSSMSAEARGGSSGGDGGENLYLKASED